MIKRLLMGASGIAILGATASWAQTAPPTSAPIPGEAKSAPAGQADTSVSADPTAPADAADTRGLADIIVTATKVETTLQKTPQAITTINGDALVRAGIDSVQQLNKLVGGLEVEQVGLSSAIYIRGVGSRVLAPTSDPAVAFSVDGVYYGRPYGAARPSLISPASRW